MAELDTHYQINQKWGTLGGIAFEPNVQPTFTRNPGLPTYTRVALAAGAEYEMIKGLKAKLVYAHVFSKAPLNMSISTGAHIQGHENVDAVDFSINYDVLLLGFFFFLLHKNCVNRLTSRGLLK